MTDEGFTRNTNLRKLIQVPKNLWISYINNERPDQQTSNVGAALSRVETTSEVLKTGGVRDEDVFAGYHLCESPTETEAELTLRSRDLLIFVHPLFLIRYWELC